MAGLINTGLGYQNSAMSGFIRESSEEAQRDKANKQLALQSKNQNMTMLSQGAGVGLAAYNALSTTTTAAASEEELMTFILAVMSEV